MLCEVDRPVNDICKSQNKHSPKEAIRADCDIGDLEGISVMLRGISETYLRQ